jgi:tripartite-type tricarboxylate transporter receptor subunit TctC
LTGELFQVITGVKLTHVPYKGTGPALVDLIGGQTHCLFDQVSTSLQFVNTGKLRPLAVTAAKRSPLLPNVPTMLEAGVRDFEAETYTGIFLPSATPKDIVNRVYTALLKVLDQRSTRDGFARLGAEVIKSTPEELSKRIAVDFARWKKVQQQTGIKLD